MHTGIFEKRRVKTGCCTKTTSVPCQTQRKKRAARVSSMLAKRPSRSMHPAHPKRLHKMCHIHTHATYTRVAKRFRTTPPPTFSGTALHAQPRYVYMRRAFTPRWKGSAFIYIYEIQLFSEYVLCLCHRFRLHLPSPPPPADAPSTPPLPSPARRRSRR